MPLDYPLDENSLLRLHLEPSADHSALNARLYSEYREDSALVKNLLPLVTVESGRTEIKPTESEFRIPLSGDAPIRFTINGQLFGEFSAHNAEVKATDTPTRTLSVFETRIIGRAPQREVPYSHRDLRPITMPITDLHTHLSGQISGEDLINIGLKHNILYPTSALDMLGIAYPTDRSASIPKREFLPRAHLGDARATTETAVPLSSLSAASRQVLQNAMSFSPEKQSIYEDMEIGYYLREPFTKNIDLLPDILLKTAEGYRKQGIDYAELSSNAVVDPKWLKVIHDVLPDIEKKTKVQLRFLVGVPRNLNDEELGRRIEQIKRIAPSPYIVGVDILGYEMNKTSHLQKHLKELAGWMRDHRPDMTLRIHAGENSKNPDNVKESLQLALDYGIRLRIGHAIYGIDNETLGLAKKLASAGKLIVEFNPDCNLASNNVDFPDEIPILKFIHEGIPSVLASDGAGFYLTSVKQTAMAGLFCGVTPDGFDFIHQVELSHIAQQQNIFDKLERDFPADFFEKFNTQLSKSPIKKHAPAAPDHSDEIGRCGAILSSKRPVFIAGAAGLSWDMISSRDQQEAIIGLKLLMNRLDPDKVCFVTGRTKDRGIGIELGKAVADYNASHDKKFECLMMLAEGENGISSLPRGITQKLTLPVALSSLPNTILSLIQDHDGLAYFIGGRAITRDFIVKSIEKEIPCGLMDEVRGGSSEKARIYNGATAFHGAKGMVEHMHGLRPEIFAGDLRAGELDYAYNEFKNSPVRG